MSDEPLRVAHGRDVGLDDDVDQIRPLHRGRRVLASNAGIQDRVGEVLTQQVQQRLQRVAVADPVRLVSVGPRQDGNPGMVLDQQRRQEVVIKAAGAAKSIQYAEFRIQAERHGRIAERRLEIEGVARVTGKTGVEMEALTAVAAAALTIYDMCKAVDREMTITDIRLVEKRGGRSGLFRRTGEAW